MRLHKNASLTIRQRIEVKRLHEAEGISLRALALRFRVNLSTIQRWVHRPSPLDLSSTPERKRQGLTLAQQEALRRYRKDNPEAGPKTIAINLAPVHGVMNPITIYRYLKGQNLIKPAKKKPPTIRPLRVGKHRLQMDVQQLQAIEGGEKFEYKLSVIHMATRMKYSEIHPSISSEVVVSFLRKALAHMPPFFFGVDR